MSKIKATQEEIEEVRVLMDKEKVVRVHKRYQALYLSLLGEKCRNVAKIVRVGKNTVIKVKNKYKKFGVEGLSDKAYGGRPKMLSNEQELSLKNVILTKMPVDVGFPAEFNWTAGIIGKYVNREYKYNYSIKGITILLARLNLSYTRPSYVLAKADKMKQEAFKLEFEIIKKRLLKDDIQRILFEDEAMIRDYQAIHQTWFEKGKQKKIKTYGKHAGVKLVGFLNYETGEIYCEEHEKYDAEVFLGFLKNVIKKYPKGKSIIIVDNAKIHHAKLLKPFLKENNELIELVFLPPYSPDLNMIEGLWKWLKEKVIYNVFYSSVSEIRENINSFLNMISRNPMTVIDRLCCLY